MKAVFDREALAAAFQLTSSVVPARTPKVILQNVKLTVTKKHALLKATDLESVGITMEVRGVQVGEPGDLLLPTSRVNSKSKATRTARPFVDSSASSICRVRIPINIPLSPVSRVTSITASRAASSKK
jgi:DNA polymerase-3 subunit beta